MRGSQNGFQQACEGRKKSCSSMENSSVVKNWDLEDWKKKVGDYEKALLGEER